MFNDFHSEIFSWVRGALLVMFIINLTIYLQNRKILFFYYSCYLFFIFAYFIKPIAPKSLEVFFQYANYSLLYTSFVFYVLFARVLISTKQKIPKWDKLFLYEIRFLVVFVFAIPFVQLCFGEEVYLISIFVFSTLINLFSICAYVAISRVKGRNVEYFIIGSLTFLVLGNLSTYLKLVIGYEEMLSYGLEPMLFTYLGAFIEALVFTYIMGRIFRDIEAKKTNFKLQYLLKQKETAELKMTALQSQMNPHFLFNSLNSINNFVLKNKKEEASDYIASFSKLIRIILKNSQNMFIPFEEELATLDVYVGLEQKRISGGFDFIKKIDSNLRLSEIKVPPLFLQPFIENSIWHGLVDKGGEKQIELVLEKKATSIVITIVDNGIGIDKAKNKSKSKNSKRRFFGASATEKRIKLLHKKASVSIQTVDISDQFDTGTKVIIEFPLDILET